MQLNALLPFAIYLLGIFILAVTFKQYVNKNGTNAEEDWQKKLEDEHHLQFVRNKPLDQSLFIHLDFKSFPTVDDPLCQQQYLELMRFGTLPMINLKHLSNLELKKQYGPQVVDIVSNYERNFTQCMQTAIAYAKLLMEQHYLKEAQLTLEQCVCVHCDISKCYILLIDIYKMQNDEPSLAHLKEVILKEMSDSPFVSKILRHF